MKVAIDISSYYYSRRGVTRYIRCLVAALKALENADWEFEEIAYRIPNFDYQQPTRALKTVGREFIWAPFIVPLQLRWNKTNLFHMPGSPCLRAPKGIPKVVTLHDLEMFHTPDRFRWWTRKRFPLEVAGYRKADRLICDSQSTADDAIKFLDYPARRMDVIPLASHFQPDSPESAPSDGIPDEYFLFVSSLEPGKNLRLLNEAYHMAESRGIVLPPLLVVGERVEGVSHEGEPPKSWRYLGRRSDEELAYLYRRSIALLAPTRYEGFGLPVLEAMTLGTAVICSKISSLPEVGGDIPFYAEQTPADYLIQMLHVLREPEIRRERIEAGRLRAATFSWQRCAEQTLDVYRHLTAQA